MVYRVYSEKKAPYAAKANQLLQEIKTFLDIQTVTNVRIVNRYDVEGIDQELFETCKQTVFSEPPLDDIYSTLSVEDGYTFGVEFLPGQFDQRADSAAECIQLISQGDRPLVRSAEIFIISGTLNEKDLERIKKYVINPVEAREASLQEKETLVANYPIPKKIETLVGFNELTIPQINDFIEKYGLAMDSDDIAFCQAYFKQEQREPTITEIRIIDTYWSDHCRHTTFTTHLEDIKIEDTQVSKSFERYQAVRDEVYAGGKEKPITLMNMGTIGAKVLKQRGLLKKLDESDEINACSVHITVDNDGTDEDWLLLFKNETHNHPTEIEPFGGAATCIGGAIRDPLANRGYVYSAMRITGAANPLENIANTLPGKLPQHKICTTAAAGFSSYGNQIGLATGQVKEIYHPGYMAKRMEIGAVMGAVPLKQVRREEPSTGDVVILIGGKTGRDGIGGATGSSKSHKKGSLEKSGAEVQKGNAPVERKLQRLFRREDATLLIKRCNDFGAGGVSVAIGELADGIDINLDAIPKKYEGLDGTEIAISESQERMAVVVEASQADNFIAISKQENLQATIVGTITDKNRLCMYWNNALIADLGASFLNSNGAPKQADAFIPELQNARTTLPNGISIEEQLQNLVTNLNMACQKGLTERFDSTIGAATVLMPLGGKYQLTPTQAMVHKLPVKGETTTCSGMAYGFDPYISEQNPYQGAYLAVIESVAKLIASGFRLKNIYLTFQEYFERLQQDNERWGKPVASLLGALDAQLDLEIASIGGKDSMSGSFEHLNVPPTLVSFAVATDKLQNMTSNELKLPSSQLIWLQPAYEEGSLLPTATSFRIICGNIEALIRKKRVLSIQAVGANGVAGALFEMMLGNQLGAKIDQNIESQRLFEPAYGSFIIELAEEEMIGEVLGETTGRYALEVAGEVIDLNHLQKDYEEKLSSVYPYQLANTYKEAHAVNFVADELERKAPKIGIAKPRVLVPVFPGNNCEYDTARALEKAGAIAETFVVHNLTPQSVAESAKQMAEKINNCQMIVIPGGFSGGDEPEGSAKLITAFFRGKAVKEAVSSLLDNRDGLMLGICNGFQALVKLGLLPYGHITDQTDETFPTLTFNPIGRHQSSLVRTRIASTLSPWLAQQTVDTIHTVAISHGEGRFIANETCLKALEENGQIATQYVDFTGVPSMNIAFNPNASDMAIEGITSPDGRILGKMGHSERVGNGLYMNVTANTDQKIFESGVSYFDIL